MFNNKIVQNIWNYFKNNLVFENKLYEELFFTLEKTLLSIDKKISYGKINLINNIKLNDGKLCLLKISNNIRIGVLAFTANPIHWGHIISSLMLIDELNLNQMVFLIQGEMDYKTNISNDEKFSKELRHKIVMKVLKSFNPIIKYSNLGFNNNKIGEYNSFKILENNPNKMIELYYFSGSENLKRVKSIINNLNLAKSQNNFSENHNIKLALVPIGNFLDINEKIINESNLKIKVVLKKYNLEIHSTQYRNGDISIVPKDVDKLLKEN